MTSGHSSVVSSRAYESAESERVICVWFAGDVDLPRYSIDGESDEELAAYRHADVSEHNPRAYVFDRLSEKPVQSSTVAPDSFHAWCEHGLRRAPLFPASPPYAR